jgi:hypothetical protein
LTKQQERQDEEFLHCSHFPIIRKHYNDFRDAVKLPKEGAVIRQHPADTPHMASRALSGGSPRRLQPTPPAASNFYASAADGLHSYLPG